MNSPLLSPDELLRRIDDPSLVLLDARPNATAYAQSHLRGAVHADLDTQLSAARDPGMDPANGGRHPLPPIERFAQQLGDWGITPESFVVVYDDQSGANAAARAWWMLRAVGHENVVVLDGGYSAAVTAGVPISNEVPAPAASGAYPVTTWQRPTVDRDAVNALRSDPQWRVLDVRSAERYRGETEPIDPIAGHIPGAINLFFSENLREGRFKSPEELRAQYEHLFEGTSPDHVIVHCGSGVTACHTLLALEHAGLRGANLYVGSWGEWCRNDLPREPR